MLRPGKKHIGLLFAALLFVIAGVQFVDAAVIHVKAVLAQYLLQDAWQATLAGGKEVKPWPWADTWPVAHIKVPRLEEEVIVLAGADAASLPFGPGHVSSTSIPGEAGVSVISAHRDTHFAFLQNIQLKDIVYITDAAGRQHEYSVIDIKIVDARRVALNNHVTRRLVLLTTCFPFDAVMPGGPLRYVVTIEKTDAGLKQKIVGRISA